MGSGELLLLISFECWTSDSCPVFICVKWGKIIVFYLTQRIVKVIGANIDNIVLNMASDT